MNMRLKAVLVAGFLLVAGTVQATVIDYDGFTYPAGTNLDDHGYVQLFDCDAPVVTDEEITPGQGNCITHPAGGTNYGLRIKSLPASIDVTVSTVYISMLVRQSGDLSTAGGIIVLGLANTNTTGGKIEGRITPLTGEFQITGWGGYANFSGGVDNVPGKLYRAVMKIAPIAGETNKVMVDLGLFDVNDAPLPDESEVTYQFAQYTYTHRR